MKNRILFKILIVLLCDSVFVLCDNNSLVVSTTEPSKEVIKDETNVDSQVNPKIYSMQIHSNVSNRFATTLVTSKVRNLKKTAEETTFSVILPENAFISAFEMEIDGKVYKAHVKEKEEAKQIYQEAVSRGQSAGHVELNARDSKTFTVSVNIEPESKTTFRLTYEELLQRQLGQYELVVNIHPGQPVEDLTVQVHINESRALTFVRSPSLRTGNEISKNDNKLDPSAKIEIINSTSARVEFNPDANKQKEFGQLLGSEKENGLAGQFVVQYDVERDPQGGEVLVKDGYFVHFFAPSELTALPKHVVFVLDHSGSMSGRNIEQLIEAMQNILSELKENDLFNIVRFADDARVWNIAEKQFKKLPYLDNYGQLEPHLKELNLPEAVKATKENIEEAKSVITDTSDMGMTNIIVGLEVGLFLIKRTQENTPDKYQPMIIFLTDGYPNVGMSSRDDITKTVTTLNSGKNRAAIFSLSFGDSADKDFLRKLSSKNLGFSRHIYEASDASLQLQDFYRAISSPLLSNVTFAYVEGVADVTKTHYPILFNGSELIVAGRTSGDSDVLRHVWGRCVMGPIKFNASRSEAVSSLERLWAYLTVKQLLKERDSVENSTVLTKRALDLSLKYSFVTPVSSLVVVKPNQTESVESKEDKSGPESRWGGPHGRIGYAMIPPVAPRIPSGQYFLRGGSYGLTPFGGSTPYQAPFVPMMMPGAARPPGMPSDDQNFRTTTFNPIPHVNPPLQTDGSLNLQIPFQPKGPRTTRRPKFLIPKSTTPSAISKTVIPQWLEDMKLNNDTITTPQGTFKLGQSGDVITRPQCPKSPSNVPGECVIIFDCPEVFSVLTDVTTYLKYFCPLNEYAGVCCPLKSISPVSIP